MKNKQRWKPSKYVYRQGKLKASRDPKEVGISSRLITDLVARFYDIHLKEFAKGKLLDLGCGKVPLYATYKDHVTDIVCVDWINSRHKNDHLDLEADLNQHLPLVDGEFDTILLSDVMEHIKEPKSLWREMNRILVKDGIVLMNVPFYYCVHEEPYDYFRYTQYALSVMAQESGFKVIKLEALGGVPEVLTDILTKVLVAIPLIGKVSARILNCMTWLLIHTRWGREMSIASSKNFPLAYALVLQKVR